MIKLTLAFMFLSAGAVLYRAAELTTLSHALLMALGMLLAFVAGVLFTFWRVE